MQKKLIALAIAGLSGAAFAQSNVTVYGQVNMFYGNYSGVNNNGGAAATTVNTTLNSIDSADSRLGFKGEEALGNGMKAVFTAEFGFMADTNGNTMSNGGTATGTTAATGNGNGYSGLGASARQTFAGLSGNFGTVTLGRQYTPFFEAAAAIDPSAASTTNVTSMATLHPIAAIARANNSIKYVSPLMNNFLVAGLYGLGERTTSSTAAGNTADPKVVNVKLAYVNGPILAGITHIKMSDNLAGTAIAAGDTTKATAFGGTYDMKTVKLHALYDKVQADIPGTTNAVDRGDYMLGVSVPMGASTFKVTYNRLNDKTAANVDGTHWGLNYTYAMSKRTNLVANYAHVSTSNTAGAGYTLLGSSIGAGVGRTSGLQLGMAHSF